VAVGDVKYRVGDEVEVTYTGTVTRVHDSGKIAAFKVDAGTGGITKNTHVVGKSENIFSKLLTRAYVPGTFYQDTGTGVVWLYSTNGFWYRANTGSAALLAHSEQEVMRTTEGRLAEMVPQQD
jgi:putative transposon-encoded protein